MPFERFIPAQNPGTRPKATIRPTGLISFDSSAVKAFGLDKATHVVLFFDKNRKLVGVQPTSKDEEHGAFKLSRRRHSVSLKAPSFFDRYALALVQVQKFEVTRDPHENMLTIDIKGVQRRRGRPPKRSKLSG